MSDTRLAAGFLGSAAGLSAIYLITQQRLIWVLIGLASAAMIAVGVHRNRPRRREPWYAIMAALVALTIGDAAHFVVDWISGPSPFPSVADVTYLLVFFPLMVIGMEGLARSRLREVNRSSLLDALIVTSVMAWLSWTFLITPVIENAGYAPLQKVVAAAYPVTSVFLVALVIRLASAARWTPAVVPPVLGVLAMLAADAFYGLGQLRGDWLADGTTALGWFALYAGWALGALHPSMAALTEPRTPQRQDLGWPRLAAVGAAAVVPPVVLVIESLGLASGHTVRRSLILALVTLVLVRLYTVVASQRGSLARERTLRSTGAALVSATTVEEVTAVVRSAVDRLLPQGVLREVVLEVDDPAATVVTARQGIPPAPSPPSPSPASAPASAPASTPASTPASPPAPRRAAGSGTGAGMPAGAAAGPVHRLGGSLAGRPGIPEAVLRCPVTLAGRREGEQRVGLLYVAASEAALADLQAAVEVLASQTALALDRIRLTGQINRHASEQYFRTLVQSAADMIMIVDLAGGIRYASPSATAVLEHDQVTRLHDLVAPEDVPILDRALSQLRDDPSFGTATAECTVLAADGRRVRTEVSFRDLRADPTVRGVVVTLHDVTEQRRLQRELTYLAFHDALTGLANRALFYERLDRSLVRYAHQDQLVGVLFLDLDDLKRINDTMGHAVGDQLLAAAAHRFDGALGEQDTAARLGGDEFAALVEGLPGPDAVEGIARRVVAAFQEPFQLGDRSVSVGVSIGVATAAAGQSSEDLLRQADLALYGAKQAGKGRWERFAPGRDPGRQPPRPAGRETWAGPDSAAAPRR